MKKYYAQLQAHGDVPEDRSLQLDLNYSIQYRIYCPINRCKSIKKNGFDRRHSQEPQWFKCKDHGISFYAHTSWVIIQLTQIVLLRILTSLFAGKKPANALAEEYRISQSTISRIIHHSQTYVDYAIATIKRLQNEIHHQLPDNSTGIIWLDEIFFKAGGVSFPLIVAINQNYQIVGWRLGKTRNADDIQEVLQQVDQKQEWDILVADGAKAYPKALRERGKSCYFIRHKHSHPWEITEVHKFEVFPFGNIVHSIVELRFDALVEAVETPQLGYTLEKTYFPKKKGRKRGRPKGSKNKKKKQVPKSKDPQKRGPKTPKSHGKPITLDMTSNLIDVRYQDPSIKIDHSSKNNPPVPPISVVQELIWVAFCVFNGRYMVSSLIESKNSVIRHVMPDRGMRTETHLKNHLVPRLQFHSGISFSELSAIVPRQEPLPIRGSIGFYNLSKFLRVDLHNLQVLSAKGGM